MNLPRIDIQNQMFVYALENASNPQSIIVSIPDILIDRKHKSIETQKISKGSMSMFNNINLPSFSNSFIVKNNIRLPVLLPYGSSSSVSGPAIVANGSSLEIMTDVKTGISLTVGIGNVKIGDRLLAVFINQNPKYGIIIGRC